MPPFPAMLVLVAARGHPAHPIRLYYALNHPRRRPVELDRVQALADRIGGVELVTIPAAPDEDHPCRAS